MNPELIEQLLTSYALGDLDADTARTVEAHLEKSETSRGILAEIRETLGLLERALHQPLPLGAETLDPVRRAAVLAPPPEVAAAAAAAAPRMPMPAPLSFLPRGWLSMAATLAIAGGALWVGVRQHLGDSQLRVGDESAPVSQSAPTAPMEISFIEEASDGVASKTAAQQPVDRIQEFKELGDNASPADKADEQSNLPRPEVAAVRRQLSEPVEELKKQSDPADFPKGGVSSKKSGPMEKGITRDLDAPLAAVTPPNPSAPQEKRTGREGKSEEQVRADSGGLLLVNDVAQADQSYAKDAEAGERFKLDALKSVVAEAPANGPALSRQVGEKTSTPAKALPPSSGDDALALVPLRTVGADQPATATLSKGGGGSAPLVAETPAPPPAAKPAPAAPAPAAPAPVVSERESQFSDDFRRQAEITGYSQSATRQGAAFAAMEQGALTFNSVGGRAQINESLYPGVRAMPGTTAKLKARGEIAAKSSAKSTLDKSLDASESVFRFGFVKPFNLAALLEESVAAGKVDPSALGAQPERWAASFDYAVTGRPMGDMRAGVRRLASPIEGAEVLVVLLDSGEKPVSGSMRVVLRPDAARSSRLVGYASANATLIPGDSAPPASLAVAVIELVSPNEDGQPLGRLEVDWSLPGGEAVRETLPLRDFGLSDSDASWAAAMAMTADALQRADEAALQAWGRLLAGHPRNRPGTPEARVIEALRKVIPGSVPVPQFRKS